MHVRCPRCYGPLDRVSVLRFDPYAEDPQAPGLWRYRHTFAVDLAPRPEATAHVGLTPLQRVQAQGRTLFFKREDSLPSGSVKDRAVAVLAAWAMRQGLEEVATLGTPNTLRAWAWLAPPNMQVHAYGPALGLSVPGRMRLVWHAVPGPWQAAKEVLLRAESAVMVPYHPLALDAYATIAYEILAQLGRVPGTVVVPVGEGALLLGLGRGFVALQQAGLIPHVPRLIGVEPLARAALWARARGGREAHLWIREEAPAPSSETGRRFPWWGDLVLPLVAWSQGTFVAVDDAAWKAARNALVRRGLYLQPEAALLWAAWSREGASWPEPVVLVVTGREKTGGMLRARVWRYLARIRQLLQGGR